MMRDNLAYQDELWDEMLDGKIVLMSPRPVVNHSIAAGNIYRIFGNFLEGKQCVAFPDGVDLYLTGKDRFVPDMMVVCDRSKIRTKGVYGAPDLVVEVLSPSTIRRDRVYKKNAYERNGVREYWIVNPLDKSVEVFRLEDGRYNLYDVYSLVPDYVLEDMTSEEREGIRTEITTPLFKGLTIPLDRIFSKSF